MTLFLRTKEGKTILDVEVSSNVDGTIKDIRPCVPIDVYSDFLMRTYVEQGSERAHEVVKDFAELDWLRGWYFEWCRSKTEKSSEVIPLLRARLFESAKKWGFRYTED